MRILFIRKGCPLCAAGGHEQLCRDLAKRSAECGHRIPLLTGETVKVFIAVGGTA